MPNPSQTKSVLMLRTDDQKLVPTQRQEEPCEPLREKQLRVLDEMEFGERRHHAVAVNVTEGIAFQLSALRRDRQWSRRDLAERSGVSERVIAKWENPNAEKCTFDAFLKIAKAFDVSFLTRFAPFRELAEWFVCLGPQKLSPMPFEDDRKDLSHGMGYERQSRFVDRFEMAHIVSAADHTSITIVTAYSARNNSAV